MRFHALLPMLLVPAVLTAQTKAPTVAQQITLALLTIPKEFRADAAVLGYNAAGKLVTIRDAKGAMICLADDPSDKENMFHTACYSRSIEPFMLRGRQLRESGVKDPQVDTVRFAEVKSGKIAMPKQAALWRLDGPMKAVDAVKGTLGPAIKPLYVIYMPFATSASTGIPSAPANGAPWLMLPGTAKAHVMFSMDM